LIDGRDQAEIRRPSSGFRDIRPERLAAPTNTLKCGKIIPNLMSMRQGKKMRERFAKYNIGQVVRHRIFPFRGVIFDVDPEFANTEEWWNSIPAEVRPAKDQPFYHLYAENAESAYVAYVSEQNLLPDPEGGPVKHPAVLENFVPGGLGVYRPKVLHSH
jgi:heat shock protein HspQ